MKTPIIDPSTLTEEQREIIRTKYREMREVSIVLGNSEIFAGDEVIFEWLFGKKMFEKGGNNESRETSL